MENPFEVLDKKLDEIIELLRGIYFPQTPQEVKKPDTDILTVDEAAALLHISKGTIYKHVRNRKVPHFKKGKRLYFLKNDLLNWIGEGRIKTMDEIDQQAATYLHTRKYRKRQL